jgi:hypothetical protein
MSGSQSSNDPYQAVIADLEAQIAQLQAAIATINAVRAGATVPTGAAAPQGSKHIPPSNNDTLEDIPIDAFHTLTVAQGIKKYLGMRPRKPATSQEIVEALQHGGQNGSDGANFSVVVNNSLNRMSASDGEVSKVRRGVWGLKSWYSAKAES